MFAAAFWDCIVEVAPFVRKLLVQVQLIIAHCHRETKNGLKHGDPRENNDGLKHGGPRAIAEKSKDKPGQAQFDVNVD